MKSYILDEYGCMVTFYKWIGLGGGIFWLGNGECKFFMGELVSGVGWTFFMGEWGSYFVCEWMYILGGIFWNTCKSKFLNREK